MTTQSAASIREESINVPKTLLHSDLQGKTCLVTGGANGIGLATAEMLAGLGASVCILDLDLDAAKSAAARIESRVGVAALGVGASVSNEAEVQAAVAKCASTLGPVDVLVNSAGILAPSLVNFAEIELRDMEEMLRVHVMGTSIVTHSVISGMLHKSFGRIINLSSVLGLLGGPRRVGYSVAKHAIVGFTRSLAVEVARSGVTVNAIAPGYVLTERVRGRAEKGMLDYEQHADRAPAGRWAVPEEVAHAIAFLALPASAFITGVVLPVDGGYSIRGDAGEDIGRTQPFSALASVKKLFF